MKIDLTKAEFMREITRVDQAPTPPRPTICFAGRSNVGKSTLLNSLVKKKGLARTSSTPGRTQAIIYFDVDEKLHFVDLPGYGYAKAPEKVRLQWGPMVERFLKGAEDLRLVIVILDARRTPSPEDLQLVQWLEQADSPYIFALTKTDKLTKKKLAAQIEANRKALGLEGSDGLIPFSSQTGRGRNELISVILGTIEDGGGK